MLQPSQRLGWCHWLIGGTVCCCCRTQCPKIDSFRADTLIQSVPWCSGLKLKKTVGPAPLWRLSQALLIYDVIFRLDYIFDAAYLSSLIPSENSGVSVNLSVHTCLNVIRQKCVWGYFKGLSALSFCHWGLVCSTVLTIKKCLKWDFSPILRRSALFSFSSKCNLPQLLLHSQSLKSVQPAKKYEMNFQPEMGLFEPSFPELSCLSDFTLCCS